jgi:hypothetical protein
MSRDVIGNLVAKMELESAQFQKEMARVNKSTQDYQRHAKAANDANAKWQRDLSSFSGSVKGAIGPVGSLGSGIDNIVGRIAALGPVGMAAGAAIGVFSAAFLKGTFILADYEQAQLRIGAQLKATGYASGITARQIEDLADEVARATLTSTQEVRKASGVLLQFTNIQGETFKDVIRLGQDMSAVWGGDLTGNVQKLAQALDKPADNIKRLERYTGGFSDALKENIRQMVDMGDTAKAQELILDQLRSKIGGAAGAEAQGLHGATDGLAQSWEEFLAGLGNTAPIQGATNALDGLLQKLTNSMTAVSDKTSSKLKNDMTELEAQYQKISDRIDKNARDNLPAINPFGYSKNAWSNDQRRLDEILKKMEPIQAEMEKRRKEDEEKAAAAAQKNQIAAEESALAAAQRKAAAEQKAAQDQLNRQIAASKSILTQLDNQYADEEGKRLLAHQRRLAQIETLQASEEDLARLGYASNEAMREAYYAKEMADFEAQNQALLNAALEKAMAEEQAIMDRERARQERQQAELQRNFESVQQFYQSDLERMAEFYASQEQMLRDYYDSIGGITAEGEAMISQIRQQAELDRMNYNMQNAQLLLSSTGDLFDNLASMAAKNKGEQSSLYKAMFAASKAFAIADSTVKIAQGIANAASLPFPANIPAIAATISATAGLVSTIQGANLQLSGARANGGPVSSNGWYLVGERGPELLRTGSGGGHVTSNENLRAAIQGGQNTMPAPVINFHLAAPNQETMMELIMENRGAIAGMVSSAFEEQGIRLA